MQNEEMTAEELARYRVSSGSNLQYQRKMRPEEVTERRRYIRGILKGSAYWANKSNADIDNTRIMKEGDDYLIEDEEGQLFFHSVGKVTREETEFRKIRAMMPFEFMDLTGKDFRWEEYSQDINVPRDYVNNFILNFEKFRKKGMGLYIYSSEKGSGKTMLSCCILNELVKRYAVSVKFINSLDLLEITKKGYRGEGQEELEGLYNASVLVIDDIGVQLAKEWVDTVFYRLINYRYTQRLITIYTSNLPAGQLKVDDRITDRIENTTYFVPLPEESVRSKIRKRKKEKIMQEIIKSPQ